MFARVALGALQAAGRKLLEHDSFGLAATAPYLAEITELMAPTEASTEA